MPSESPRVGRAELTQLVECQLPKLDVAGSNPVLRSSFLLNLFRPTSSMVPAFFAGALARSPLSGGRGLALQVPQGVYCGQSPFGRCAVSPEPCGAYLRRRS